MTTKHTYFISDAHFGIQLEGYGNREELFFRFLEREASTMGELYILGDLFDFWIEYRHAIRPDYFAVLHHLKTLIDRGVKVHYLAGNHDFALGSFLTDTIGIAVYLSDLSCTIQGRRVYMYHGDGLISKDITYQILKKLLRNPVNQRLYKIIHPNIGVPFGSSISGSSRKYLNKPLVQKIRDDYARCARKELLSGHDIVMYGHIHMPEFIRWPEGIYCNTGAWLKHYSYAVMKGGELSLRRYVDGAADEVFPANSMK